MPLFGNVRIPAGDADYVAKGFPLPVRDDMSIWQIMPHMHLLAQNCTVFATLPGGERRTLITVPHWDFNWQTAYIYKEPFKLPRGATFGMVGHYDNSANNPRNPHSPPCDVDWGEATTDEMLTAFLWYTYDNEHLLQGVQVHDMMDSLETIRPFIETFYRKSVHKLSLNTPAH
jgi:hypothetical protein